MKRSVVTLIKIIMLLVLASNVLARPQGSSVITKDELVGMFENISRDTKWDMKKPMLWGYFFTDLSKENLQKVAPILEQQGYHFVEIFLSDKEKKDDPDLWWLHVEKVEAHTPETLDQRNKFFYQFASEHGIGTYDGMDVGPANGLH